MRVPDVTWVQRSARFLVVIGMLGGLSHAGAQKSVEFSPSDARQVTVHAENGIELQARLNGQGPIDVVFDTGSMNVMSGSVAKKLGLLVTGTGQLDAGGGSVPAKGALVDSVQIGGVTLHHQLFAVIDPPSDRGVDFTFVGDQWLQQLPIQIDFDHQQITFYNPQFFRPPKRQSFVPVHFDENAVIAEASVSGIRAMLLIDTGSIYSLFLNSPFVKKHDLVHRYLATIRGYAGEGYGGSEDGFYTRIDALQFSRLTVKRPVAVLLGDTQGSGASHLAGSVGVRILKRFELLFDCPAGRLYLKPGAKYNQPDVFNRAGLVVDPDPDQAKIRMVIPKGPAAEAGLEVGDVITRIDGAPPTDASLANAFEQPPGTRIVLTVLHAGVVRTVSCLLSDVL